jgi:hypothetical protein
MGDLGKFSTDRVEKGEGRAKNMTGREGDIQGSEKGKGQEEEGAGRCLTTWM